MMTLLRLGNGRSSKWSQTMTWLLLFPIPLVIVFWLGHLLMPLQWRSSRFISTVGLIKGPLPRMSKWTQENGWMNWVSSPPMKTYYCLFPRIHLINLLYSPRFPISYQCGFPPIWVSTSSAAMETYYCIFQRIHLINFWYPIPRFRISYQCGFHTDLSFYFLCCNGDPWIHFYNKETPEGASRLKRMGGWVGSLDHLWRDIISYFLSM